MGSVVQVYPGPPFGLCDVCLIPDGLAVWVFATVGALAQLGEHLLCKQGVIGSIPISSTNRVAIELFCPHGRRPADPRVKPEDRLARQEARRTGVLYGRIDQMAKISF